MVAEGLGRRPAPKARAKGALKKTAFWTSLKHFSRKNSDSPAGAFGALGASLAGAFGALCPGERLRRSENQ